MARGVDPSDLNFRVITPKEIDVMPRGIVLRRLHFHGASEAYRPYRASTFSEGGVRALEREMGWSCEEVMRRLRVAERLAQESGLPRIFGHQPPERLAMRVDMARAQAQVPTAVDESVAVEARRSWAAESL